MPDETFAKNVFVNCPLDKAYVPLLKPLLYVLVALGYSPRLATERADSAEQRISKITELIGECKYSIHDLSRIQAEEKGQLARMNMPFELGVDYGCRCFAEEPYHTKQFLILETEKYRYMRALSDLNGVDIQAHDDDAPTLIRRVRNWLRTATGRKDLSAPTALWYDYGDFNAYLYSELSAQGFSDSDIDELPVVEYLDYVNRWLAMQPPG